MNHSLRAASSSIVTSLSPGVSQVLAAVSVQGLTDFGLTVAGMGINHAFCSAPSGLSYRNCS